MNTSELLGNVRELSVRAGDFLSKERESIKAEQIEVKGQGDFVSRADRGAEEMLREGLLKLLPGSVFMGEEGSPEARGGEWRWIVDPLDGTANYLAGFPIWGVSVALEDRRKDPVGFGPRILGIVHLPVMGITWSAVRGEGAFRNDRKVHVQQSPQAPRMLLATGFPFRNRDNLDHYLELFKSLYRQVGDVRRAGSAASDICWVGDGTYSGFFEMNLNPWDIAAGGLIIEEAGGVITDWWGNDCLETGWVICGCREAYELQKRSIEELDFSPPDRRWR
ncbi:MAG: inositol monophosphatase family protein [bacterium]